MGHYNIYEPLGASATLAGAGAFGAGVALDTGARIGQLNASGALRFYWNTFTRGNQSMEIIASSKNLSKIVSVGGVAASTANVAFDVLNPDMSNARKTVSVVANSMAVFGGPVTKAVGIGVSVTNTFRGEQIEAGVYDAVDGVNQLNDATIKSINYYNDNPYKLFRDLSR